MRLRLRNGVALWACTFHVACGYVGLEHLEKDPAVDPEFSGTGGMGGFAVVGDGDGDVGGDGDGDADSSGGSDMGGANPGAGGDRGSGGALASGGDRGAGGDPGSGGDVGTGGIATGGDVGTGGLATGGAVGTGGVATGGAVGTGGVATGGVGTGGAATGGAATGGSGTGGMATGGAGTGGSPPGDCNSDPENCWRVDVCDHRMKLTFNNKDHGRLEYFPVLVNLNTSRFDYGLLEPDGSDMEFIDAYGGDILAHEVEVWNPDGTSSIWVSPPQIDAGSTTDHIWMYFGCSSHSTLDSRDVWDDSFDGVWHMDPSLQDGTSSDNHGSNLNSTSTSGVVGSAREFNGTGQRVMFEKSGEVQKANTVSLWARIDSLGSAVGDNIFVSCGGPSEGPADNYQYTLNLESDRKLHMYWELDDGEDVNSTFSSAPTTLSDAGFHHYAFVRDRDNERVTFYFDGQPVGNSINYDDNPDGGGDATLWIGAAQSGPGTWNLDGAVDEVRLTEQLRSPDWIAAEYLAAIDAFVYYGPVE